MRFYFLAVLGLMLAACQQEIDKTPPNQASAAPSPATAPVVVADQSNQITFERKVFLFADAFNEETKALRLPLSIPGAAIRDEAVNGRPSKLAVISQNLQINWFPTPDNANIDSILVSQNIQSSQQEFFAAHILLLIDSGMAQTEMEQFSDVLVERLRRLKEIRRLYKPTDPPSNIDFEFGGYRWSLGMDSQHIFYLREKL
ncbi:hypothetical protein [Kingella denitrificans]|uniref:hypothetical protein n=1 Tax=Kingella denitrificans TaxID=502 RepID=UPI00288A13AD|nr:hypothetical protein [Kingella denitrificans]